MKKMEFDTLVVSRKEIKCLKQLLEKPIGKEKGAMQELNELRNIGLASYNPKGGMLQNGEYSITQDGKLYLNYLCRRKKEMRFANTVSVIALIVSIIALVSSVIVRQ